MIGQLVYNGFVGVIGMVVEKEDLAYRVEWYWPDCIKSDWHSPVSLKIYVIKNGTIKPPPSHKKG